MDMVKYAERFKRMDDAKARFDELDRRLGTQREVEGIVVTAWLDGEPHVLMLTFDVPPGLFDGPTGEVRHDIHPMIWYKLAKRHEEHKRKGRPPHYVKRRPDDQGVRL